MASTKEEILDRLKNSFDFEKDQIMLNDDVGDDRHFSLYVTSDKFEGKSRMERSQMVHGLLNDLMKDDNKVHALTLKLNTPAEATV
jgi:stress-induced morphogen